MSPRRLGQQRSPFNYFEDTLEIEPTAHLSGSLLMPQATEKARNGSDQRLAPQGKPLRWILSRVRCIGWFAALPSWI